MSESGRQSLQKQELHADPPHSTQHDDEHANRAHAHPAAARTYTTHTRSYYFAFAACARKIRAHDPRIRIHANSWNGQIGASAIANDPNTLDLVDAWSWHHVNAGSAATFNTHDYAYGKLDLTNEMEYQPHSPYAGTAVGTVSNVNIFLNTLQFKDSPTGVMMLHAAKPTSNLESLGCVRVKYVRGGRVVVGVHMVRMHAADVQNARLRCPASPPADILMATCPQLRLDLVAPHRGQHHFTRLPG